MVAYLRWVSIVQLLKQKPKVNEREFRALLCKIIGCKTAHETKPVRFWIFTEGPDEPIPKVKMKLSKPIKPGFRRPFTITPDEPVDINAAGTYIQVNVLSGDSTVTIDPASTATSIKGWINGDGAVGDKSVEFIADGHVGEGDQQIALTVDFQVSTPDATVLGFVEGVDEPIPA